MSALVDIWTAEHAKLRQKGQTIWSTGSTPTNPESSHVVRTEEGSMVKSLATFVRGIRLKSSGLAYSEASISTIVDCFSA
ncbi:hypothetical protein JCGZ_10029 [Jatropha curcas]|uniref:Uncharacterized protein n=1 Tax=Jatropha curcas TaxID=180498 RepID=A0A067LNY7_JATCU|nr:hypothetical protein JCGZ_10029 [Jatropha curcas]